MLGESYSRRGSSIIIIVIYYLIMGFVKDGNRVGMNVLSSAKDEITKDNQGYKSSRSV